MPAAFLAINTVEANLATPIMMGRQFPLNNVAIFVGFLFWWYLWGIPGALLAVPLMVALYVCCEHIEKLKPYGAFLKRGRRLRARAPNEPPTSAPSGFRFARVALWEKRWRRR
jgi:predicted PurR-regulated permease PerM